MINFEIWVDKIEKIWKIIGKNIKIYISGLSNIQCRDNKKKELYSEK